MLLTHPFHRTLPCPSACIAPGHADEIFLSYIPLFSHTEPAENLIYQILTDGLAQDCAQRLIRAH